MIELLLISEQGKYTGWLINMHAGDTINEDKKLVSCIHYYFLRKMLIIII